MQYVLVGYSAPGNVLNVIYLSVIRAYWQRYGGALLFILRFFSIHLHLRVFPPRFKSGLRSPG